MPPTVPSARYRAYLKQQGRCFYCGFPMWLSDLEQFARANRISLRLAQRFKCTTGGENAAWPSLLNDQVKLTTNQEEYQPGQTAAQIGPKIS